MKSVALAVLFLTITPISFAQTDPQKVSAEIVVTASAIPERADETRHSTARGAGALGRPPDAPRPFRQRGASR